jgi:uncharacterized protein (DUF1800 family)
MSEVSDQKKIQHLYLRAGFGAPITVIGKSIDSSTDDIVDRLFNDSKNYTELTLGKELLTPKKIKDMMDKEEMNKDENSKTETRKMFMQESREDIFNLNVSWINKMANDKEQLREKMTLFWHGHFACSSPIALFNQNQNNLFRKYALGSFADLLKAVSKDAEMLQFLNNQQNRKESPNENFAREVMELFTLGRGNYTEQDIKNSARAFTGWQFDEDGNFIFRKGQHDDGNKTFFGKSGDFKGDDILNIILENKKTAPFLVTKIYKYYVNENVNSTRVKELADDFYNSNYNIGKLIRSIFTSDWFYNEENIGIHIKSPIELLVGLMKSFNIRFENSKPLYAIQRILGQILLYPPNVAGWAGGRIWIDTSSLIFRLKLAETLFKSSDLVFDFKDDKMPHLLGEDMMKLSKQEKQIFRDVKTSIDMNQYINYFLQFEMKDIYSSITEYLVQADKINLDKTLIMKYTDSSTKKSFIESLTLKFLSIPEYQLS